MSARNRPFPKIGKKMLSLTPLARQKVSPTDSVLGPIAAANLGLTVSYSQLIQQAFNPKYWGSNDIIVFNNGVPAVFPNPGRPLTTNEFTQMEANFSLFFGLAVQLYEATLVSDETPFDRFAAGDNNALTSQQLDGLEIFLNQGKCIKCHAGAEFTSASVSAARFLNNASHGLLETVPQVQTTVIYDQGYYNIGLRPTAEDLSRGGTAPFTNPLTGSPFPLSFILLAELQVQGLLPFPTPQLSSAFPIDFIRASTAGRFKASGLRNVELTGPFFHNGDSATLEEVVDFYTRGGNFPHVNIADLDPDIMEIPFLQGLPDRTAAVVAFLKALTDERVRQEVAPFDHPQLFLPNGHPGDSGSLTCFNAGNACDTLVSIPAVGAGGRPAAGLPPLQPFLSGAKYFAAGDFDEDGKTDITVWRPGDGSWRIIRSSDGAVIVPQWGLGTDPINDIPVPGDYDGDGKTDLAVWRPGDGTWYVKRSSDGVENATPWGSGAVNDVPVPGDYDGDGKTDLAVWRPGEGNWYIKRSSDGVVTTTPWGLGTDPINDIPVPGDYDGDGKTDLAVWRPGDGTWYVKRSSDGVITTTPWGAGNLNDVPVPADFDGDGKTDIAVYRPGSGDWFVIPSGGEAPYTIHWGGDPADIPMPPL
jgi:cytochrome c peroxidase